MKLDDIYQSSDTIKAEDLNGKDVTLTISKWEVQEFEEEGKHGPYKAKKIVLGFAETDRRFVLNKTNGYQIAEYLGRDDPANWVGCKVTLFPTRTNFGSKMVDCVRVKAATAPKGVEVPGKFEDANDVPF